MADDERTPEQIARDEAERTGNWPDGWGPFHRHFCSDAIHRDGGPECDQPGTPRRVYVFDAAYLSEHEAVITRRAAARALPQLRWAPYREFGIPDPVAETEEPPACPFTVGAHGYRGNDIIVYWTVAGETDG
jgi:hypothetical protein